MTKTYNRYPNQAQKNYLSLAYNRFFDIFDEVFSKNFWRKHKQTRYFKVREAYLVYSELLNYEPLKWVLESIKAHRPPMEAEIGSELFKFIRNVIVHFPFFDSWNDVYLDKGIVNRYTPGQSIDKFLRKYEGHKEIKYRIWEEKIKKMTYLSINFPTNYAQGKKVWLKDIFSEKEGVKFSLILMKQILDTQVEEISG